MAEKLTLQFYTPDVAPPYAYNVISDITNDDNGVNVDFKLEYLGREDFTNEELEEEGFSKEDDFEWNGRLNKKWQEAINSSIESLDLSEQEEGKNIYVSATEESDKREGYLRDENLEYLIQELQQAVFEAAGRELPFTVHAKEIRKGEEVFSLTIIASFLERKVVLIKDVKGNKREETLSWEKLKDFMSIVFSVDYKESEAVSEEDIKEGFYIEPGDESWYPLPNGIEGEQRNFKSAENLMKALKEV